MKLIRIKTFAVGLVIATLALTQYSCEPDGLGAFHSSDLLAPATSTVAVNTIKDSTAMLDYTISAVGRVFVVVLPGDAETVTPDAATVLKLTTANAVFTKQIILSDASSLSGSVEITGLVQNTSYKVFALPVNADGVLGVIVTTDAFITGDTHAPILTLSSGVSPAISSGATQETTFKAKLTFDEPVVLADPFAIQMGYRNAVTGVISLVDVPVANIAIASNVVTITQPQVALNGQYVFLSIGAGSFLDRAGNAYAGVTSTLSGGTTLVGIYWRVKFVTTTPVIFPKENVTGDLAMKITLDYPIKMRFPTTSEGGYVQANVLVRYSSVGITVDMEVPQANVAIVNDTLVQITLPRTPVLGETVTLKMAEGAMRNSYGNPCAAVAFGARSWFIASRDLIIGNYNAKCVSDYGSHSVYNFAVTITADPGLSNGVIITGLENTTVPINGIFNEVTGKLVIAQDQSLGDLMGDGSEVFIFSHTSDSGDLEGTIKSNGTITMDWASYIVGGDYDGYYYDKYTGSVWTKAVTKSSNPSIKKTYVVTSKVNK